MTEENPGKAFYLTWTLLVTGFSFALFALLLSLIEDQHVGLFGRIGGICFTLGLITGGITLLNKRKLR